MPVPGRSSIYRCLVRHSLIEVWARPVCDGFITGADLAVDGGMLVHLSSSTDPLTRLARMRAGGG